MIDCMPSASVGLWIDQSRAVIVFAKTLTAHLVESRHSPTRFYDTVITALGAPGPVLITGPGETKTELQERMEHSSSRRSSWVVEVKPSACTSNREILAELAERLQPG
jgi:hypothetical protein